MRALRVVGPIARRGSRGRRCRRRPAFAVTDDSIRAGMALGRRPLNHELETRRDNRDSHKLEPGLPLTRLPVGATHMLLGCAGCFAAPTARFAA